jgi:hypothetical protein
MKYVRTVRGYTRRDQLRNEELRESLEMAVEDD